MLYFMFALSLALNWHLCRTFGPDWHAAKAQGGFTRVLAWCGAISATTGFSCAIGYTIGAVLQATGHWPAATAAAQLPRMLAALPVGALLGGALLTAILIRHYAGTPPQPTTMPAA
jgi:TRAP-type C4-dicarboxylate transport system permease small subunit